MEAFFAGLPAGLDGLAAARLQLVPGVLVAAKSTAAPTRQGAAALFASLFGAGSAEEALASSEQLTALIKAGKTSSPDHRATLYAMLATLPASEAASKEIVGPLLTQLPKETQEAAVAALHRALAVHLATALSSGAALAAPQVAALVKSMQEPKPSIRRAACATVGAVLWSLPVEPAGVSEAALAFATGVLPGLESGLKTVTANPLNSPAGPLEGYVAVAVLKGRLGRWGCQKIDDAIAANPTLQALYVAGPKPTFLLWDKVYRKLASAEEEAWFLHALEAVVVVDEDKFAKDSGLRSSLAHGLVQLATESAQHETRKAAVAFVERANARNPGLTHKVLGEGLRGWLLAVEKAKATAKPLKEDEDAPADHSPRITSILGALASFGEDASPELRQELVAELVVIAHHPRLASAEAGVWIGLLQRAEQSPEPLIEAHLTRLFELLWADAGLTPASLAFAEAAYRAATTLALVLPATVVPQLFAQFADDLDTAQLAFMGPLEYGVWATPAGVPFVDPLAAAKPRAAAASKNSKERELEMWEAEVRAAQARKQPVAAQLSKQDRALLEKQLAAEAEVRTRVAEALGRLRRGFQLLLCLVNSRADIVREYLATMVNTVLKVVVTRPATLVGPAAFSTYQTLGDICSERLGVSKEALGVAVLRGVEAPVVPDRFAAEPLPALVTRVLHKLRYIAEQSPFDAGTFAYAAPLISKVLRSGGIGLDKTEAEAILEQVSIALDFIGFHAKSCADVAFPRLGMIGDLLAALAGFPVLSRSGTQVLAELAEAINESASAAEIQAVLDGAMTEETYVRFACLQAVQPLDLTDLDFSASLWIAAHDVDGRNRELAMQAWQENALDVPEAFAPLLIPFLAHASAAIREAAAVALAEAVDLHPALVADTMALLIIEYHDKAKELVPVYDQYGMLVEDSLNAEDPWRTRVALARALRLMSAHFAPKDVDVFFDLLINGEALGDRSQTVRSEMLEAATAVIDAHGRENLQALIGTLEAYLGKPSQGEAQDHITEALVILFGRLARHLDPTDARVKSVITRLVEALKTPSEVVQSAVCDCLPPLIRVIKDDVPDLVNQLLNDLFTADKYAERRGAAYGLAGVVRGRGVSSSFKEFGIMGRLKDNAEDKKSKDSRQGAVFGFEVLATVLGRLFEPYISEIVPVLLQCFGDSSTDVREATQDAARAIMGKLSGHAVKLILPTLLMGLDDKQWRGKKGAIELMGAMAFLAPKQLSTSLPTILPRLTEVLTDTHKQVRESANTSLKRFGDVVENPEIQAMVPVLLAALVNPSDKTPKALDALLTTTFAHFIDSSSLALLVPILDRGLRERSADVKRKAAAIVGNMATLTDGKDLVPYLNQLVPLLRSVLVDPVPEARSTAAKSLGGLVERLGEHNFADLIDELMAVLKSPSSGVDQQGAAQGVAEVLAGLGTDRLEGLLPTILANTSSPRTYVREGHISLLIFLPVTFGDRFAPYLGRIIQPVMLGLADDSDYVREASMRAGRMIVASHSHKAVDLLLPELEVGLFEQAWRIRLSSVQLTGDLLFRLTGISGKIDTEADEDEDAEGQNTSGIDTKKILTDTLGKDRRDKVLASLYIARQDNVGVVRQAAIGVWKALVSNTPRTAREILPTLMSIIVRILAAPGIEQRETAARCLADTCRRLGESVLGEVIAILQKAMGSSDRRQREGVCLALSEIMANTPESSLEAHEEAVIAVVRSALVDQDPVVRSAAAQAFDVAQQVIGTKSIDETIPTLLEALQTPGETADAALAALTEVMQVRADKIFPILIPKLIAAPISAFNAKALGALVRVAGSALGRRLTHIVDALYGATQTEKDEDTLEQVDEALAAVLSSVTDHESGLGSLMMHMLSLAKHESSDKRVTGCTLFQLFCQASKTDFDDYRVDWIRQLISLFDDRVPAVVGAAWLALDALIKSVPKDELDSLVVPLRRTIESTGTPGVPVDGFSRPNGLKPILPVLLQGLLSGTAEQREQAAYALGDLVERTAPDAFKAYCIQTVGPLIRVIGDRFPAVVKSAILSTLTTLLLRVPQFVKPFFPQLQRTFVKSLTDGSSLVVRNRGAVALGGLMKHQPRIDPLVTELCNLAVTEEGDVRDAVVNGLAKAVEAGGTNLGEASVSSVVDLVSEAFADAATENYNKSIARLLAALYVHHANAVGPLVASYVLAADVPPTQLGSLACRELLELAPAVLFETLGEVGERVAFVDKVVASSAGGVAPSVARPAREAKELLKEVEPWSAWEEGRAKLG